MTGHNATVVHLTSGWIRWAGTCPCGWFEKPQPPFTAQDLVDDHNDQHGVPDSTLPLSCTCFDPRTGEFIDDLPCPYCRRLEAEGVA